MAPLKIRQMTLNNKGQINIVEQIGNTSRILSSEEQMDYMREKRSNLKGQNDPKHEENLPVK